MVPWIGRVSLEIMVALARVAMLEVPWLAVSTQTRAEQIAVVELLR